MRTGGRPLVVWGCALALIALLGVLVFGLPTLPTLLLVGAGLGAVATGIGAWLAGRQRGVAPGPYGIPEGPDSSPSAVLIAVGATMALTGLMIGEVFVFLGLGAVVLAGAGLILERPRARDTSPPQEPVEPGTVAP